MQTDPTREAALSDSAEQPAASFEQPAREAAQSVKALRSIPDVQRWLKNNEVVLSSSAEAMRMKEVVGQLSRKPKPRQEAIERFFKPWCVQQRIQKKHRPLSELIEELSKQVVEAAARLQADLCSAATSSAEQPALSLSLIHI